MIWLVAAIIGVAFAALKGYAGSVTQQATIRADELKAQQLEELSKEGGYYDQALAALESDLADVEKDRAGAAQALAMTNAEIAGATALSVQKEAAQVAGLEANILGLKANIAGLETQKQGEVVSGLETAYQGAQAKGSVGAQAGAGNLAQTGSILRRAEAISRTTSRRIGLVNKQIGVIGQNIGATEAQLGATQQQIGVTQAAGIQERLGLGNDITRASLSYQDTLRALQGRELSDIAQQTKTEFEQQAGTDAATTYSTEADWLKANWWLPWVTAGFEGATTALNVGTQLNAGARA